MTSAEVIVISRDLVEKDYVVALFHLVRVALVFCSAPLILALMQGHDAVQASNATLLAMPSIVTLPPTTLLTFAAISIIALPVARFIRLPMPHLVGPDKMRHRQPNKTRHRQSDNRYGGKS